MREVNAIRPHCAHSERCRGIEATLIVGVNNFLHPSCHLVSASLIVSVYSQNGWLARRRYQLAVEGSQSRYDCRYSTVFSASGSAGATLPQSSQNSRLQSGPDDTSGHQYISGRNWETVSAITKPLWFLYLSLLLFQSDFD